MTNYDAGGKRKLRRPNAFATLGCRETWRQLNAARRWSEMGAGVGEGRGGASRARGMGRTACTAPTPAFAPGAGGGAAERRHGRGTDAHDLAARCQPGAGEPLPGRGAPYKEHLCRRSPTIRRGGGPVRRARLRPFPGPTGFGDERPGLGRATSRAQPTVAGLPHCSPWAAAVEPHPMEAPPSGRGARPAPAVRGAARCCGAVGFATTAGPAGDAGRTPRGAPVRCGPARQGGHHLAIPGLKSATPTRATQGPWPPRRRAAQLTAARRPWPP